MRENRERGRNVPEAARSLLEKHIAWLGGEDALAHLETVTMRGTLVTSGLSGTVAVRARRDGYRLLEIDLGVYRSTEGITPDDAWEKNTSGQIESLGLRAQAERRFAVRRSFGLHLHGIGCTIHEPALVTAESGPCPAVAFEDEAEGRYEILIDAESGASTWERELRDRVTTWYRNTDWRFVDGIRVAHQVLSHSETDSSETAVTWETISFNEPLDPSLFARPAHTDAGAEFSEGSPSPWLPIRLHADRYVLLDAKLNGHPFRAVLDSGAGMSVLDVAEATRLGLIATGAVPTFGVGGRAEAGLVEGVALEIGGVSFGSITVAVLDLSDLSAQSGMELRAILGKEVFLATNVEIDYPAKRLRMHERKSFVYAGSGHRLPLHATEGGQQEVDVQVEDLAPARFQLDTGSSGTLSVFQAFVDRHRLLEGRAAISDRKSFGVGGEVSSRQVTLRSVTFAGFTMPDVPATLPEATIGAFATTTQAGNLGAGILSRFCVVFDYAHECLWIEPRPESENAPFARNRSGLQTRRDGELLEIIHVAKGSPAEAQGFTRGERIVAIDGRSIGPDYYDDLWRWSEGPEGTRIELEMSGGARRTLTLRTYY